MLPAIAKVNLCAHSLRLAVPPSLWLLLTRGALSGMSATRTKMASCRIVHVGHHHSGAAKAVDADEHLIRKVTISNQGPVASRATSSM
jgi:hypothetical protein